MKFKAVQKKLDKILLTHKFFERTVHPKIKKNKTLFLLPVELFISLDSFEDICRRDFCLPYDIMGLNGALNVLLTAPQICHASCMNVYRGVSGPGALGGLHREGGPHGRGSSSDQHQELHEEAIHGHQQRQQDVAHSPVQSPGGNATGNAPNHAEGTIMLLV